MARAPSRGHARGIGASGGRGAAAAGRVDQGGLFSRENSSLCVDPAKGNLLAVSVEAKVTIKVFYAAKHTDIDDYYKACEALTTLIAPTYGDDPANAREVAYELAANTFWRGADVRWFFAGNPPYVRAP